MNTSVDFSHSPRKLSGRGGRAKNGEIKITFRGPHFAYDSVIIKLINKY